MAATVLTSIRNVAKLNKKHSDSGQVYTNLGHQIIMVPIIFMKAHKVSSFYITSADDLSKMGKIIPFLIPFVPLSPYLPSLPYYL
jgi:hypothetical protein